MQSTLRYSFETLSYTCGECNYGGKVTDTHDRHTLATILSDIYTPALLTDGYTFSESGIFYAPEHTDHDGYLAYIGELPILSEPEAFGLHENANINKDLQEVDQLLGALMLTQSADTSSTGKTREELIAEVSADLWRACHTTLTSRRCSASTRRATTTRSTRC